MNGLPRRSLGLPGWQPAGDSSPQLEQFICCNYWQDNTVGALGTGWKGSRPRPSSEVHSHTWGCPHRRISVCFQTSYPKHPFPHPREYKQHLSRDVCTHLELTWEPSDGIPLCVMWQKSSNRNYHAQRQPNATHMGGNRVICINKAQRVHTQLQGMPGTKCLPS